MPKSQKGEIVLQFVKDYEEQLREGQISKKGLARLIFKDYPDLFKDVEDVRALIRQYTGAQGDKLREQVKSGYSLKSDIKHGLKANKLPDSLAQDKKDFILPTGKKYLILSDIHLPFHNEEALQSALDYGIAQGCTELYLNGDVMDNYWTTRFTTDPRLIKTFTIETEINQTKQFLNYVNTLFDKVYYKFGNHENRWRLHLWKNADKLSHLNTFDLENVLELATNDITYISDSRIARLGKLTIMHGHEIYGTYSPVNPAKGMFNKMLCSTMLGHFHQTSTHHQGTGKGDKIGVFSTGCLCTLTPDYSPLAYIKWNHGAATVESFEDGSFHVDNFRIINGKCL